MGIKYLHNLGKNVERKFTIPQNCLHSLTKCNGCMFLIASHLSFIGSKQGFPSLIIKYKPMYTRLLRNIWHLCGEIRNSYSMRIFNKFSMSCWCVYFLENIRILSMIILYLSLLGSHCCIKSANCPHIPGEHDIPIPIRR